MRLAIRKILKRDPRPLAIISTDEETLPLYYRSTNNYWQQNPLNAGYTGLSTYVGYAPWPVYFEGWGSSPASNIVSYYWDFGIGTESDYGGRYFEGINAAHLYETPGIYTVILTITDKYGRISTSERLVTILDSIAENKKIYYVDPVNGSDAYDGLSQTVDSASVGPWQTFDKVISMLHKSNGSHVSTWPLKPGDKVLLKRSTTAICQAINKFNHGTMSQGIHIGTYGTGDNPKVQWSTPPSAANWQPNHLYAIGDYFINNNLVFKVATSYTSSATYLKSEEQNSTPGAIFSASANGPGMLTITDIDFYCNDSNITYVNNVINISDAARNICFARCHFHEPFNTAVLFNPVNTNSLIQEPYGIFILGCTATQDTISNASIVLLTYGCCAGLAIIGTEADKSGNHINYLTQINSGVITDNVFSRPAFGRTALRITGGSLTGPAQRVHVTRNKFLGWIDPQNGDILEVGAGGAVHNGGGIRYNFALVNLSHNGSPNKYLDNIIFERNILTNFEEGITLVNNRSSIIRNNIFVSPSESAQAIRIGDSSGTNQMRPCDNVKIINNTFMYNGSNFTPGQSFIKINSPVNTNALYHNELEIRNNLIISTAGRDDIFLLFNGDLSSQIANMQCSNNLLDSPSSIWAKNNATDYDLTTWQNTFNKDTNSLKRPSGTVTTYSTGISHSSGFPDSKASAISEANAYINGLKLTTASAAAGAAYDPDPNINAVISPVTVDFEGIQRTNTNNDIGAFEAYGIVSDFDVSLQGYVDQQAVSGLNSSTDPSVLTSTNALYQPIYNEADSSLIFNIADNDRLYSSSVSAFREAFFVITNISDSLYIPQFQIRSASGSEPYLITGSNASKWRTSGNTSEIPGRVSGAKQLVHVRYGKNKIIISTDGGVEQTIAISGVSDKIDLTKIYITNHNFNGGSIKLHHILTTTALTGSQRTNVIANLKTKWNIA